MENETKEKSIFYEFTGKYQLSKTLQFELKPVGNTPQMLEDEDVFEKDRIIREKYRQTRPYFDRLHREFIEQSLKNQKLSDLEKYFQCLVKLQKDKDAQEEFKKISQNLRTEVNDLFKIDPLFGEAVFTLLKEKYGEEDKVFLRGEDGQYVLDKNKKKISIFDSWKGFTGYFTKFQETRRNFYKDDGTATAVATRIVDQNLKRFCENIQVFKTIKNKVDFIEVEDNFSVDLDGVFSFSFYNSCLLQEGIDAYNKILGGETKTTGEKLKGLNELINKYRQDNKDDKLPFLKMLDKQILSEKEKFIESIEDDEELLKTLKEFYFSAEEKTALLKELFNDFTKNNENHDLSEIYISREALNTISHRWVSIVTLSEFEKSLYEAMKKKTLFKSSFDKNDNTYKFPDFIPLSYIKGSFEKISEKKLWKDGYFKNDTGDDSKGFLTGQESLWTQFIKIFEFEFHSLFETKTAERFIGYDHFKKDFEKIINRDSNDFSVNPEEKIVIKEFADNVLAIYQMAKYFALEKKRKWLDQYHTGDFYDHPNFGYKTKFYNDAYQKIVKVRMLLQSYLTKKPFNTDKWKLNFDHPRLLGGFTESKTDQSNAGTQYGAYLFRKLNEDNRYSFLLGVSKNSHLFSFFDEKNSADILSGYERLNYYQIKTNSIYGASYDGDYQEDKEKLSEVEVIKKIKEALAKYVKRVPAITNIIQKDYNKIKDIQKDTDTFVKENGRMFAYRGITQKQFDEACSSKQKFYLFEIRLKDFSDKSRGNKNLHTLYFEQLVSANQVVFDIGSGEMFHRPKTNDLLESEIITKKNNLVIKKKDKKILHNNRYLENKSFLHLSVVLNSGEPEVPKRENGKKSFSYKFNQGLNNFLADNPDINIIGVDRGEKHLIYYAGIDQKGNILKDNAGRDVLGSLNEINGVNYHALLEERAKAREKARQDWQNIQGIKDLKRGYISLVVRKLADLIIEHNAILVLEDLNMRFKQIRGGIEKSVYQQLEKALIEKLNFLVNKGEKDPKKAGHLLRAYQLTAPFSTFKNMGKQTGVLFYTQASYTSKTCPQCGFRPNIKLHFDNLDNVKKMFEKIDIVYKDNHFEIIYKVSDFVKKEKTNRGNILYEDKQGKDSFTLSSKDAIRYKWFARNIRNNDLNRCEKLKEQTEKGVTIEYDITECLRNLFEKNGIACSGDIAKKLIESELPTKFYKDLFFYLYVLTNTRSSISGTEIDYINCPACGFHSEMGFNGCTFNGDANGAYNIARKGVLILQKINQYKKQYHTIEKMGWGDLFIGIEEWDKYTQTISKEK